MSYAIAGPLQAAIYQHLLADAGVSALVGTAVLDALPTGEVPETYVRIGPEEVREAADKDGAGALHKLTISVVSDAAGFATAKAVAGAVSDALDGPGLVLSRGRLVGLWFERARAVRDGTADQKHRIDLRFRARVEDN